MGCCVYVGVGVSVSVGVRVDPTPTQRVNVGSRRPQQGAVGSFDSCEAMDEYERFETEILRFILNAILVLGPCSYPITL